MASQEKHIIKARYEAWRASMKYFELDTKTDPPLHCNICGFYVCNHPVTLTEHKKICFPKGPNSLICLLCMEYADDIFQNSGDIKKHFCKDVVCPHCNVNHTKYGWNPKKLKGCKMFTEPKYNGILKVASKIEKKYLIAQLYEKINAMQSIIYQFMRNVEKLHL